MDWTSPRGMASWGQTGWACQHMRTRFRTATWPETSRPLKCNTSGAQVIKRVEQERGHSPP